MRHADFRTTNKHYTVLGLTDTAKAVDALPDIDAADDQGERATGTADALAHDDAGSDPQPYPRQLGRESRRLDATQRDELSATGTDDATASSTKNGPCGPSDAKRATGIEPATFSLGS